MMNQSMKTKWMSMFLLLAVASLTGCGQEVVDFNNKLAKMEDKLEPPMEALMGHFQYMENTKGLNAEKMDNDYTAMLASLDGVIKEAQAVPVIDAAMAKEFHAAYISYYGEVRNVITGEIRQGLDLMKDKAVPDAERPLKWEKIAGDIQTKLGAATANLQNIQKQFASKHRMRLE